MAGFRIHDPLKIPFYRSRVHVDAIVEACTPTQLKRIDP